MKYDAIRRRQFLIGGGAMLALPLLPSLLPSKALADPAESRHLTVFRFGHNTSGGRWLDPALATTSVGSVGAKEVQLSTLDGSIGEPMAHETYESLRRRGAITMLRGLDCVDHPSGHGAQVLSSAQNSLAHSTSRMFQSIDTVLEDSSMVYPEGTPAEVIRAIRINMSGMKRIDPNSELIASHSSFAKVDPAYERPLQLYQALFGSIDEDPQDSGPDPLEAGVISRVFESYRSARASRRISNNDRHRLDEHLDHLRDVESRIRAGRIELACAIPDAPADGRNLPYRQTTEAYLKLMAMAIKCGLTKVQMMGFRGHSIGAETIPGLPDNSHLHNDVLHNEHNYSNAQVGEYYVSWKKWYMDMVAEHFIAPLDVEDSNTGRTFLDNGAVAVVSESGTIPDGPHGHENYDYQSVLMGSMGGYLRTDRLVAFERFEQNRRKYGLPYNTFLITLLEAMGLRPEDYRQGDAPGFGLYKETYEEFYGSVQHSPIQEIVA